MEVYYSVNVIVRSADPNYSHVMTLSESRCSFSIPISVKQTRPGTHVYDLCFRAYLHDPRLCLVKRIQEYITRTMPLSGDETQLLISFVRPHKAVSKDAIGRWIKSVWRMLVLTQASLVLIALVQLQFLLQKTVAWIWQPL